LLSIEELRSLSPWDFEKVIARMFERMGFAVQQTPKVNDRGRDAILTKDEKKFLLECKRYKDGGTSGRPDLQKFHSAIIMDEAVRGYFVTAGGFSNEAKAFAETVPIDLVDQYLLRRMMFESDAIDNDAYQSMCRQCGETVDHRLRTPRNVTCCNGHPVAPTLNVELVVAMAASPPRGTRGYWKIERRMRAAIKALSEVEKPQQAEECAPVRETIQEDCRVDNGLEDATLRLSSGEVRAGNDLRKLVDEARTIRNLLNGLHSRYNRKVIEQAAIAGVLRSQITGDAASATQAAAYIARRLDALADETERGWSGTFKRTGLCVRAHIAGHEGSRGDRPGAARFRRCALARRFRAVASSNLSAADATGDAPPQGRRDAHPRPGWPVRGGSREERVRPGRRGNPGGLPRRCPHPLARLVQVTASLT
jgi:hypothetical protein